MQLCTLSTSTNIVQDVGTHDGAVENVCYPSDFARDVLK
jgi:hypothetical protein